jgi:hypothetical protein
MVRLLPAAALTVCALAASSLSAPPSAAAVTHHRGASAARASAARASAAHCAPGQLSITVPAAIAGDPSEGMGNRAWNIVLRNVSAHAACSLLGWPQISVRTRAGRSVTTRVTDVTFSNLGPVPDQRIALPPGGAAVATVTGAAAPRGCAHSWALRLALPGSGAPVTVAEPAGPFVPCVGGQLRLSPFYRESLLEKAIRALAVPPASSPFHRARRYEPPACAAADLRAKVTSAASGRAGVIVALRLRGVGRTCVLAGEWPTVMLHGPAGTTTVAKALPDDRAFSATAGLLMRYRRGRGQRAAVPLRRGHAVSVTVLASAAGRAACEQTAAATIYPSAAALGAGVTVSLPQRLRFCAQPRILPFLPARRRSLAIAQGALTLAGTAGPAAAAAAAAHPTGWWRGTDSAYPYACGNSIPYSEPAGACSNGTAGYYGTYIGQVGGFQRWRGCGSGLNWLQDNYDAAQANAAHGYGLGAAAYWFAAGPGRDPHYNGTVAEASRWGTEQAQRVVRTDLGDGFQFPYVFMDIENNGAPPDENGWNSVWNGPCGSTLQRGFIRPAVDIATVRAFLAFIYHRTDYFPAVYSAGVVGYGSWGGIFGGEPLSHASEWTYANETSSVRRFPVNWSVNGAKAAFFSGGNRCQLLWQWSGGNGVLNSYGGDLDQVDATHIGECPGDGPKVTRRT